MGSEGRGEQTFRTDQDNGLILAGPVPEEDLAEIPRRRFRRSGAVRLPALSGRSDGAQPVWSKTLDEYRDDFRRWLAAVATRRGMMNIAIFYDAEATAGDAELLQGGQAGSRST